MLDPRIEVRHPDPAAAIQFIFTVIAFALRELLLTRDGGSRKLGVRRKTCPRS
jgi:hypothetical protein